MLEIRYFLKFFERCRIGEANLGQRALCATARERHTAGDKQHGPEANVAQSSGRTVERLR